MMPAAAMPRVFATRVPQVLAASAPLVCLSSAAFALGSLTLTSLSFGSLASASLPTPFSCGEIGSVGKSDAFSGGIFREACGRFRLVSQFPGLSGTESRCGQ
jgi:hypothetical protein